MKRPARLSESFIRSVKTASRYGDGPGGFGLSLLVKARAGGGFSKSFSQRLRVYGKPVYIGLGAYPLLRLSEAREIAIDNARIASRGGDPRQTPLMIPTFAELAEVVITQGATTWATNTAKDWRGTFERYVYPKLGGRAIDQITAQDLLGILEPILAPTAAEKVRRNVATVFARSVAQGYRTDNPAVDVRAMLPKNGYKVNHHDAIPHAEVGAALARLSELDAYTGAKDALAFLILTATRSAEVTGARWTEIDLDAMTWTIPAERYKTGLEHVVPLSRMAVQTLKRAEGYGGRHHRAPLPVC